VSPSVRSIAKRIAAILDCGISPSFGALPDRSRKRVRTADVAECDAQLCWRAAVSLEHGLDRTIGWARELLADETARVHSREAAVQFS
jgi:nucleoside-diphosphate-sugar epimerase